MTYYQRIRQIVRKAIEEGPSEELYIELLAAIEAYEPHINVTAQLQKIYVKEVERGGLLKTNKGVTAWELASISPQLRDELNRRIMFSVSLIKQNKMKATETTLQRFNGWLSSLPAVPEVRETQIDNLSDISRGIGKPLAELPYDERRVAIDQSQKLIANLNQITAYDCGAIGAYWHSHWRQAGYDYREDHKELSGKFYVIKNSPAMQEGLVKKGGHEYLDELPEQPGEAIFCRCYYEYIYRLGRVPEECLTQKGKEALGKK